MTRSQIPAKRRSTPIRQADMTPPGPSSSLPSISVTLKMSYPGMQVPNTDDVRSSQRLLLINTDTKCAVSEGCGRPRSWKEEHTNDLSGVCHLNTSSTLHASRSLSSGWCPDCQACARHSIRARRESVLARKSSDTASSQGAWHDMRPCRVGQCPVTK